MAGSDHDLTGWQSVGAGIAAFFTLGATVRSAWKRMNSERRVGATEISNRQAQQGAALADLKCDVTELREDVTSLKKSVETLSVSIQGMQANVDESFRSGDRKFQEIQHEMGNLNKAVGRVEGFLQGLETANVFKRS